jgi:DNA-binding transcriptional ArsR family regulator
MAKTTESRTAVNRCLGERARIAEAHQRLAELDAVLAALAHASRRQMLVAALAHGGAMSAGAIADRFSHSWPTTSRHLRVLQQAGLLQFEKRGRTRVYRLNYAKLQVVCDWLHWFERPDKTSAPPAILPQIQPEAVLRDIALAYPEAHETVAGNARTIKVRKRTFLLLDADGETLKVTARLPISKAAAVKHSFATPIRYRFGASEWVVASFSNTDDIPMEVLWEWIDESYRATAPRKLLGQLNPPPVVWPAMAAVRAPP